MDGRDSYEKENTARSTRLLKRYLAWVGLLVGLLTMYQSTVGIESPFYLGTGLTGASASYLLAQWWLPSGRR